MGKIYFPVTGSPESRKAIPKVISISRDFHLDLTAIAVVNHELLLKMERYRIFIEEETSIIKNGMAKDADRYLNYIQKLGKENGVNVTPVMMEGDPYSRFIDYIKHDESDRKIVCIIKKCGGEFLKDIFSPIERKLLLNITYDIIVIGESV